jgi:hypothetical protein
MKEKNGKRRCLMGNIGSARRLPYGTPADVAAEVRKPIDIAAPGGGYVLASDQSLLDGIAVENILEMFRVGRGYGGAFYSNRSAGASSRAARWGRTCRWRTSARCTRLSSSTGPYSTQ